MKHLSDRRNFIGNVAKATTGFVFVPFTLHAQANNADPIDATIVKEFVGVAHHNLDKTKSLLDEYPHLLNAAWDWGDGDFETACGAAGHVGNKEIANYLLSKGARFDIFMLTMLGKTALVQSVLDAYPQMLMAIGPHGYTLLHHAKRSGTDGEPLAALLESKGLNETRIMTFKKAN